MQKNELFLKKITQNINMNLDFSSDWNIFIWSSTQIVLTLTHKLVLHLF